MTASIFQPHATPSAAELAALLAAGSDWHLISDPAGHLIWADQSFIEAAAGSDLGARTILPPLLSAEPPACDPVLQQLIAGGLRQGEVVDTLAALSLPGGMQKVPLRLRISACADLRLWTLTDLRNERVLRGRLQHLEELLDTVQEFGRLGVWERDIITGEGRWDDHVFRFWGLDPSRGTPSFNEAIQRIHPDDVRSTEFALSTQRPGRYSQRFRVVLPDGKLRWLHSQWEIKASAEGRPVRAVGVMVDDTEAIAKAHSLDNLSAKLAFAVELGEIAIFQHDLRSKRIHFNARGLEMLGLPNDPQGVPIEQVRELLHPEDKQQAEAALETALTRPGPVDMQARYRRPDGRWRHLLSRRVLQRDALDRPVTLVGVALDVSERVQQEFEAAELARRLEIATSAAAVGIWSRDMSTGEAHWNGQMFHFCGWSPEKGPPSSEQWINEIVHPQDRSVIENATRELMQSPSAATEYEYRICLPDGAIRWLIDRVRHETWSNRSMSFGATLDVTERRAAEEFRREAQAAQRRSDAKAAMLAQMSHELRTPLNAILGFTQLLTGATSQSGDDPSVLHGRSQMLGFIRTAAEQLLELVDDVLELSTVKATEPAVALQPVALEPLLRAVVGVIGAKAKHRAARVTIRPVDSPIVVLADEVRLRRVMATLIGHQLTIAAPTGAVEIALSVQQAEVQIRITANRDRQSEKRQGELFRSLAGQALDQPPPAALDMSLFDTVLAAMNGRVETVSGGEQGSLLQISLPLAEPAARTTDAATTVPASSKVLYIEDNPVNVILVKELIARRGEVEFRSEPTGLAGVDRAAVFLPDLVLIDINLPDIDGFEVLRRLRQHPPTRSTCCVALSANAVEEDIERAKAAGFDDYWTKPIRFGPFLAGLERLLPRTGRN